LSPDDIGRRLRPHVPRPPQTSHDQILVVVGGRTRKVPLRVADDVDARAGRGQVLQNWSVCRENEPVAWEHCLN
jgi:hypothetical protein